MNVKISVAMFIIAFYFFSVGFNVSDITAQPFSGNILYVGGDGLNNYTKIQDAIDNAMPGDIIFVYQGVYYENVVVNKTIHLIGQGKDTTIIDGNGIGNVVYISANDTSISGFTVKNSGDGEEDAGIKIFSSNNSISDNKIVDNQYGIRILSEDNSITRNIIFDNFNNIYFLGNNTISYNSNKSDMTYSIKTITLGSNNISIYSINSNASIASIAEKSIRNYTVEWNEDIIYVIELCPNATAVKLPDNRIGIKFADGERILLPRNSTLTKMNLSSKVTIEVSDWGCLICLSSIDKFSINNLTNISYSQHVDGLHSYNLKINLFGLHSYVDYIAYYWINWGDGNKERVTIPHGHYETIYATTAIPNTGKIETFEDKFSISHRYKKSGTYPIKIGVVDNFGNKYTFATHARIYYEGPLKHTYFVIAEYKEPIATASGSVGFATLLAFILFTEPGKYKFLSFLLIPLYTRIKKEDMLDNFVRGQIYGLIKTNPGIHYNDIMRKLELKNGALSYHLQMLEKTGMIKSRMEGLRYRAFYPTDMKFPEKERYRLSELQIEILKIIKENDGIIQNEIKNKLDENRQKINYNVKILHQAGLVKVIRRGRKTQCYLTEEGQSINEFLI